MSGPHFQQCSAWANTMCSLNIEIIVSLCDISWLLIHEREKLFAYELNGWWCVHSEYGSPSICWSKFFLVIYTNIFFYSGCAGLFCPCYLFGRNAESLGSGTLIGSCMMHFILWGLVNTVCCVLTDGIMFCVPGCFVACYACGYRRTLRENYNLEVYLRFLASLFMLTLIHVHYLDCLKAIFLHRTSLFYKVSFAYSETSYSSRDRLSTRFFNSVV